MTVAVHINRLREKIEDVPSDPKLLQTVWATGGTQFKTRLNSWGPLLKKFRYTGYSSRNFLRRVPDDYYSISRFLHGIGR